MEANPSMQQILDQDKRYKEIAAKVTARQVVTIAILEDRLPSFLSAGSATGFKVEKIADEGEEFPHLTENSEKEIAVSNVKVQGKGYIAISIEKPEGSKGDHFPFWKNLESLRQEKA